MTGITYVVMPIMLRERCICSLLMWRADTKAVSAPRESMTKSVLLQAFTRQKADSYIECLCPNSSGRSSRESVFEKYNPNYLFDKVVTNLGDDNIDVCETNLYLLGIASEIKKSYLRRKVMKALQASLSDNVSEYKEAVKVALQAYVSQLRADKFEVDRLVNIFPPAIEQLTK